MHPFSHEFALLLYTIIHGIGFFFPLVITVKSKPNVYLLHWPTLLFMI
jgi:hypothetical protein